MARHVFRLLIKNGVVLKWLIGPLFVLAAGLPAYAMNVMLSPGNPQNGFIGITGAVNAGNLNISGGSSLGGSLNVGGATTLTGLTVNGGETISGTLSVNTLVPVGAGSLTIGSSANGVLIQGTSVSLANYSGSNSTKVGFIAPTGIRSVSYPDASGTVC